MPGTPIMLIIDTYIEICRGQINGGDYAKISHHNLFGLEIFLGTVLNVYIYENEINDMIAKEMRAAHKQALHSTSQSFPGIQPKQPLDDYNFRRLVSTYFNYFKEYLQINMPVPQVSMYPSARM